MLKPNRERRRLGLSAPDNYGGLKDKGGFAGLNRNQENPINIPVIQKIDPYAQQQQPFIPQQLQQPPIYQPPAPMINPMAMQVPPQQQSPPPHYQPVYHQPYLGGGPQQPFFPQPPPQQQFIPQGPYMPPQQDFSYSQQYPQGFPPMALQQQQQQPFIQQPPPPLIQQQQPLLGRQGGQPRQGGQHSLDARESFFDKFGQQDNERALNNMNAQDKAKRLRMELDQQVLEKNKRKEEEKLEREKWELKYGEGSWINQITNQTVAAPGAPLNNGQQIPGQQIQNNFQQYQPGPPIQQLPGQFQPGQQNLQPPPPGQANPLQSPHVGIQVHQLPGGGTSIAHGAVPDGSPARNQSQVDAYKNELMTQIEEKKKKQDAERKRKQDEDEKDEARVKKEMEDLQKRYQQEINPEAAAAQQQQEEIEAQQKAINDKQQQQQNQGVRGSDQGGNPSQYNQSRRNNIQNSRRQGPDQQQYDRNGGGYQDDGYYQQDDQGYNNQDRRGGNQQYNDQNRQGNYNRGGPPQRNEQYDNNYDQNYGGQEEIYQDEYQDQPYYEDNRNSPQRRQGDYYNNNNYNGPPNQYYNDGPQGRGPSNQMMAPMMMPPPMPMANFDPLKKQLQSQLTNFQKDIMRLQNQQKSMMRNYHKEIEMLQRRKQQILGDLKTDQNDQMQLQIQQLSSAIQLLGQKMSLRDQGLHHSLSPRRNDIVSEVLNQLNTVLPIQQQPLQYHQARYSQSYSPPPVQQNMPPYALQQDPYFSELPMQINKNQIFTQQAQNPKRYNEIQLPSTTVLMPHDSPRYKQQQELLRQQLNAPIQANGSYDLSSVIQNPNAPNLSVDPNIAFPEIEDHTQSLKQKALQLHNHPLDRSQLKSSMNPRARTSISEEVGGNPTQHDLADHRSSLQLKAAQLKQLNDHPRTSKAGLFNHSNTHNDLEEIAEEDDRGQTPISDENGGKASLKHKPSITSIVSNSARYKEPEMQEEEVVPEKKQSAPPRQDIKKATKDKKAEEKVVRDEISTKINAAPPQQRLSVIDQIRYKNQQPPSAATQQQVQQTKPLDQSRRNSNASKIDPRKRVSNANLESGENMASQLKNQKPFEMKEQKSYAQRDLPPYIVSQSQVKNSQQSGQTYKSAQVLKSDQYSRLDQDQVVMKSLQLGSNNNNLSHQALSDSLDSLRRREKHPDTLIYMPNNNVSQLSLQKQLEDMKIKQQIEQETEVKSDLLTQLAIGQALDSIRKVEEIINVKANGLTNEVLYEALDSIRRLQGETTQIQQQFPQYGQQLQAAHDQLTYLQGANNRIIQGQLVQPQQRGKFNQQDVNDALNSIKQVQATLEAKNLLSANPQQLQQQRMSVPPYAKIAEERPLTPIEEEVKQQIKILQNNLFSPYRNPYDDQPKEEYGEELAEDQYSERFESDNQQAIQNQYYQVQLGQQLANNPFVGRSQAAIDLEEDNKFFLSQQSNSPKRVYEELRAELPKFASQNLQSRLQYQDSALQEQLQYQELVRQSQMLQQQLQYQQMQNSYGNQMGSPLMQHVLPEYSYDEEFEHLAKEDSAPQTAQQNQYTYTQSAIPIQGLTPQRNSPLQQQMVNHNMIINVSPPPETQSYQFTQLMANEEGSQEVALRQGQQQLGSGNPRLMMEQPYPIMQPQTQVQQVPQNQVPSFVPQKPSASQQAVPQISKQKTQSPAQNPPPSLQTIPSLQFEPAILETTLITEQQPIQPSQVNYEQPTEEPIEAPPQKQILQVPPWRSAYPPQQQIEPVYEAQPDMRSQQSRQSNLRQSQKLQSSRSLPQEAVNLAAVEPKKKREVKPEKKEEVEKYKYEPEGIQYNIEQTQHVLAQDLLYQQLVQYERQHFEEMQEYVKQQEEVRRLEQQINGGGKDDAPKELVFPDFTNFLYNKFLINGAPAAVENEITRQDSKPSPLKSGINLSTDTNAVPSPRAQFKNQVNNAPQFALYQKDPFELDKPPTQLILKQIQQSKANLRLHHDDPSSPLRIVPHTPSLLMRPVTHAAPRPQEETREDETDQFLTKINDIQRIVDKYERIKKDVEIERMKQEHRHVNEFGQEYMKSLKKVEDMVRDKDTERWNKKMGHSVNIGQEFVQQTEAEVPTQMLRQSSRQQGFRPKFGKQKGSSAVNVDLPGEQYYEQNPASSMTQVDREIVRRSIQEEVKNNPEFSRSYNNQSDELNLADSSYNKTVNKSISKTLNHSPENKKGDLADSRQIPKLELPSISQPSMRPQTGQSFLRDMIKDVPSINQQSKINKPPLPPINQKQSSFIQNSRNANPLENSGYLPKNFTQQPIQLPPIRQNSFHSNETDKSVIDIFNGEGTVNMRPIKKKKDSGSYSDFFEAPLSAKFDSKGDDPFSLRDRLRQTIQDTHQMVTVDNINLLQKVRDFDRTIKPASYDNGLPPVIDLAYTGKQSTISIYNAPPQHAIVQPDPIELVQEPQKDGSIVMQKGFAGNFHSWDNKRAVIKHTEDRYNIRPSQGGQNNSDQSFQNNEFVKEIIQSRNTGGAIGGMTKSLSSQKLQPITGTPKNLNGSLRMLPGMLGQSMEQQQRATAKIPSVSKLSQPILKESIVLPPKKDSNPKILESIHESPASSVYDAESRRQSFGGVVYKVVEHTVETPRDMIFGIKKPSLAAKEQEKSSSGGVAPFTNQSEFSPIRGDNQITSSDVHGKAQENPSLDMTRQNIQQKANIQEISPDAESAHKWVSKWFNPDDMPYSSSPKGQIPKMMELNPVRISTPPAEKSPDVESAHKWVSKWFNPDDMPTRKTQPVINNEKPRINEPTQIRVMSPPKEEEPPSIDQLSAKKYLSGLFSLRDHY